jgi:hypothetical protein
LFHKNPIKHQWQEEQSQGRQKGQAKERPKDEQPEFVLLIK